MASASLKCGPIVSALNVLRKFSPPQTLIHVGAGLGQGEMHEWQQWQVPHAWIIDANSTRLQWTVALASANPGWRAVSAVLAGTEGSAEFHHTTNPDEDGLLPPEPLATIWPNLKGKAREPVPLRRLDKLLEASGATTTGLWLFIDCLPALPVINGAGKLLETCSTIWARTLLQPIESIDEDASLNSIEAILRPLGFYCIEVVESNHPAIGHALFIRDWASTLQPKVEQLSSAIGVLTKGRDEQTKLANEQMRLVAEHQATIETLTHAADEQTKLAAERLQQIEALNKVRSQHEQEVAALIGQRDELEKELHTLRATLDQQSKLAGERLQQIEALKKETAQLDDLRAAGEKEKAVLQSQCEILKNELAASEKTVGEQSQLVKQSKNELEKLKESLQQKDIQLAGLENEMAERDARQQMLNDEMTRAEAQIDLIKDIVLREAGL